MKTRLEMRVALVEMEEGVFLAACHEVHEVFTGQVMFEFRICCGYPTLAKEYFLELDMEKWLGQERDIQEAVSPTRMYQEELNNLRMAVAETVTEYIQHHQEKVVIDPSAKVKRAMRNLIRITEGGPSSMRGQVPWHAREFMVEQCNGMLREMRIARNAHVADKIADTVLDALDHYGLMEKPDAQSYLN